MEERYRLSAAFRNASDQTRVTPTHYHIAIANGLGWGFDGMDGVIFALATPLLIKEFGVTLSQWRSGLQIAIFIGIAGIFFWPWLADRVGRRSLLAINIALFSLMMPIVALTTTFAAFIAARSVVTFALNGEWALGSLLVAETWPARLRGRVIGINRGTWCFGAAAAGAIATWVFTDYGWRVAFVIPAVVALIAIYVRAKCPESPYWVRMQDRKRRISASPDAGRPDLACRPGMAGQIRENPAAAIVHARHVAQHRRRHLRRLLLHHHLRHRGRLDAAVPGEGARLARLRIRHRSTSGGVWSDFSVCSPPA